MKDITFFIFARFLGYFLFGSSIMLSSVAVYKESTPAQIVVPIGLLFASFLLVITDSYEEKDEE